LTAVFTKNEIVLNTSTCLAKPSTRKLKSLKTNEERAEPDLGAKTNQ
jgi:hypothetical protein